MTQHACFLSSEPVQEGRPDQSPSQWPPARLYPWDNPNLQVQERSPGRDMQTGGGGGAGSGYETPSSRCCLGPSGRGPPLLAPAPGTLRCRSWAEGWPSAQAPSSCLGWQGTTGISTRVSGGAGPISAGCTFWGGGSTFPEPSRAQTRAWLGTGPRG